MLMSTGLGESRRVSCNGRPVFREEVGPELGPEEWEDWAS